MHFVALAYGYMGDQLNQKLLIETFGKKLSIGIFPYIHRILKNRKSTQRTVNVLIVSLNVDSSLTLK